MLLGAFLCQRMNFMYSFPPSPYTNRLCRSSTALYRFPFQISVHSDRTQSHSHFSLSIWRPFCLWWKQSMLSLAFRSDSLGWEPSLHASLFSFHFSAQRQPGSLAFRRPNRGVWTFSWVEIWRGAVFLGAASDGVLLFRFTRKPLIQCLTILKIFCLTVMGLIFLYRIVIVVVFELLREVYLSLFSN